MPTVYAPPVGVPESDGPQKRAANARANAENRRRESATERDSRPQSGRKVPATGGTRTHPNQSNFDAVESQRSRA